MLVLAMLGCTIVEAPSSPEDGLVEAESPDNGALIHMGPVLLEPYAETYTCMITRTPNSEPLDVTSIAHVGSDTLHHFNVYALTSGPAVDMTGDCDAMWSETNMAFSTPLYASQDSVFSADFPEGVAAELPADQQILIEFHALNPNDEPLYSEVYLQLWAAVPGTIETYANGVWGETWDIEIPPGEHTTVTDKCIVDVDMNVFLLGSHSHRYATSFEIYSLDETGTAQDLLYESLDWQSPEILMPAEPIFIPKGGGFEYRCNYFNPEDTTVKAGLLTSDEMCIMAALYYPDRGLKACL